MPSGVVLERLAAVRGFVFDLGRPADAVDYVFRKPTGSPADRGAPPPRYRREDGPAGMIIERDVAVPVRGGVTVYADVFRPAGEEPAPPLVAWSPYGKHAGPTQSWSNGRVGMSGVSYLTSSQWTIAATRPPHLAAINPWEGWSDTYREVARLGGRPRRHPCRASPRPPTWSRAGRARGCTPGGRSRDSPRSARSANGWTRTAA